MSKEKQEIPDEREVHASFEDDVSLSPEEAQSKIALLLSKTTDLETLTEVDDAEVKLISALKVIAEKFNMDLVDEYTNKYLQLKVSLHRQGRGEIKEIARPSANTEERQRTSLRNMLFGGVR